MASDDLSSYWQQAGRLLGFAVETPYIVLLTDGLSLKFSARLPDFGAPGGMLLSDSYSHFASHATELARAGYGYSVLDASANEPIIREDVIELLQDWGWSSSSTCAPVWLNAT
jgi:hypothetical protein